MSWQLLTGVSVLLYSISVIMQRIMLRDDKSDPIAFSIFFGLLTAIIIWIYNLATGHTMVFPLFDQVKIPFMFMAISYTLGTIFLYSGLKYTTASNFTIMFSTRAIFSVLASTLVLHEGLNAKQFIGFFFIFISILLVTLQGKAFRLQKGEWFSLAAAVCFGLANTNDRALLHVFDLHTYLVVVFLVPSICTAIIQPKTVIKLGQFMEKTMLMKMVLLCSVYALSALAFFFSVKIAPNSSQVFVMNLSSVIVIVLLSIVFLKEREHIVKKLLGAAVNFAGLVFLTV